MNKRIIMLMAAALALLSASGHVDFTGVGQYRVIEESLSDNHTSLNKIYILYDTDGVGMTYTATTGEDVVWYSYDAHSWADPQPINGIIHAGAVTTLPQVLPNKGYIIYEGTTPTYVWVVNYADYYMSLNDIFFESVKPCTLLKLRVDGVAPKIPYTEINGRTMVLDRELELSYTTLAWDDSTHWQEKTVIEKFESLDDGIELDQPLCNTVYMLSGDRFLKEWGLEERVESRYYETQAVGCGSSAEQELRGNNNEKGIDNGLGGSAPVHIVFTGYPTDAVVYRVWEIAEDPSFDNVMLQFNQDELDYTFNDAGSYYVRYMVANAAGTCEYYGETYQVTVSESELVCPNIFSPGCTEGVNDVWKVSYKSLVEFHCWIFNRWGNLVCEFTDPGSGWDGYYRGKLVDTGVYYYVVTATGSDGVKYKKRGDITILRYTKGASGTSGDGGGGIDGGEY